MIDKNQCLVVPNSDPPINIYNNNIFLLTDSNCDPLRLFSVET